MQKDQMEIMGDAYDEINAVRERDEAEAEWKGDDEDTWSSDEAEAYYADWCKRNVGASTLTVCKPEEGPDGNKIPTYKLN
jgi:hypothetical protein